MDRLPRSKAFELLPWVPTVAGVVVLAGLLVFALVSLRPDEERALPQATPAVPPPFLSGPGVPHGSGPAPTAPDTGPAAPTASAATGEPTLASPRRLSASPPPPATPPRQTEEAPTPAQPATLTGRYRTVQTFDGGFIGEVLVINSGTGSRTWTVRLRFASTIGPLRTFWVESAPQATLRQEGEVLAFTGGVPVEPRSSVALRFQLDRRTATTTPSTCTVNGVACS